MIILEETTYVFVQEVRRWLESPPPQSWLCSAHCCGRRDLDYWTAREEMLRRQIMHEQEEVFRFGHSTEQTLLSLLNIFSFNRMASAINILFLTLESPRQVSIFSYFGMIL